MNKKIFLYTLILLNGFLIKAQEKEIDIIKSKIKWTGKEITTKIHYGSLTFSKGNLIFENNDIVGGEFVVDMKSLINEDLSGGSKQYLEKHLRSDDFFSVEKHPSASLIIISSKTLEDEKHKISGDLTIKGITHPVVFELIMKEYGANANLVFDRSKYNVKHRSSTFFSDLGDKLIYDDIELEVNLIF
tara:strand:- start:10 stop:573 length:564 start_codon:yes stop_codon:yes gene_type:complete